MTPTSPQPLTRAQVESRIFLLNDSISILDRARAIEELLDCYATLRARVEDERAIAEHNLADCHEAEKRITDLQQQLATVMQERDELKDRLQTWNDAAMEAKYE